MFDGNEEHVMSDVREPLKSGRGARCASARAGRGFTSIRWRAWLSGFLALILIAVSVPIAAAHSDNFAGLSVGGDVLSAQTARLGDIDPARLHKMHGQHGILCPYSHAVTPDLSECSPCRHATRVTYQPSMQSRVRSFAPPPLLRPPRV